MGGAKVDTGIDGCSPFPGRGLGRNSDGLVSTGEFYYSSALPILCYTFRALFQELKQYTAHNIYVPQNCPHGSQCSQLACFPAHYST